MTMKLIVNNKELASQQQSNGGNGGNGEDDGMKELERRVANLETNVQAIREDINGLKTSVAVINTHLEHISKNMATKADVSDIKNMASKADLSEAKIDLTRWMIATLLGGIAVASCIVFGIMRVYPSHPPEIHVQLVPDKPISDPKTDAEKFLDSLEEGSANTPAPNSVPRKGVDSQKK